MCHCQLAPVVAPAVTARPGQLLQEAAHLKLRPSQHPPFSQLPSPPAIVRPKQHVRRRIAGTPVAVKQLPRRAPESARRGAGAAVMYRQSFASCTHRVAASARLTHRTVPCAAQATASHPQTSPEQQMHSAAVSAKCERRVVGQGG